VGKYVKYLVLISLVILLGLGMRFFESYIIPMSIIVAWVFFVAGAFAIGEKIVGRFFKSSTVIIETIPSIIPTDDASSTAPTSSVATSND